MAQIVLFALAWIWTEHEDELKGKQDLSRIYKLIPINFYLFFHILAKASTTILVTAALGAMTVSVILGVYYENGKYMSLGVRRCIMLVKSHFPKLFFSRSKCRSVWQKARVKWRMVYNSESQPREEAETQEGRAVRRETYV